MLGLKILLLLASSAATLPLWLSSKPAFYAARRLRVFLAVPAPVFCHSVLALPSPPEALPVDGQGFSLAGSALHRGEWL